MRHPRNVNRTCSGKVYRTFWQSWSAVFVDFLGHRKSCYSWSRRMATVNGSWEPSTSALGTSLNWTFFICTTRNTNHCSKPQSIYQGLRPKHQHLLSRSGAWDILSVHSHLLRRQLELKVFLIASQVRRDFLWLLDRMFPSHSQKACVSNISGRIRAIPHFPV